VGLIQPHGHPSARRSLGPFVRRRFSKDPPDMPQLLLRFPVVGGRRIEMSWDGWASRVVTCGRVG
jgi:hypothetical protein